MNVTGFSAKIGWRGWGRRLWIPALLGLALAAGCRAPEERVQAQGGGEAPEARRGFEASWQPERITVGESVEGRPIECIVFGSGEDVVLIMATIHGSEPAGTPLVRRLADYLTKRTALLEGRCVVLMPVANPDGMATGNRKNVHGVDINRNFPASNFHGSTDHGSTALSEPESRAIHDVMQRYRPDRIISLHQPKNHGSACLDYDGPGRRLAETMAARCDLPVVKLGGRRGSLGSYAGITLGVPIITVELPKTADDWDEDVLWDRYGTMLVTAICFSG
ncbi:MAG: M14 family zinc carboxypeptidase [Planctomycetota bacterium]